MLTFLKKPFKEAIFLKNFMDEKSLKQLLRYLITGATAFAVEYGTFRLLIDIFDWQKFLSNSLAMFIGFWFSFLLNRFWSFESRDSFWKQLMLYSSLFFINLVLSNILMLVFSDGIGIAPAVSKIMIMAMIVGWNFVIFKKIIYKT